MDYFMGDPHFAHTNIIKYCKRPFSSVEEMDATILANINRKVQPTDRLFVIGDFAWGGFNKKYLDQINCKNVILIHGNHDKGYTCCSKCKQKTFPNFKESHADYHLRTEVRGRDMLIHMYHYPIKEWNQWHRGSWHLFGHVHGQHGDDAGQYSLDVGVDCHNFEPLSLEEVADIMDKKQWEDPFKNWEKTGKLWKDKNVKEDDVQQTL